MTSTKCSNSDMPCQSAHAWLHGSSIMDGVAMNDLISMQYITIIFNVNIKLVHININTLHIK